MRKENIIWNIIPYNWKICGGMIVPPNFKSLLNYE